MKAGVIVRLLSFSRVEELAQKQRGRQTIRTHCTLVCDVGNFLLCKKTTRNTNHQLLPQSYTSKSDQRTETGGAEWAWERAAGADLFIQTSYHHCCCFHNTNGFKLQIHNYEGKSYSSPPNTTVSWLYPITVCVFKIGAKWARSLVFFTLTETLTASTSGCFLPSSL